MAFTISRPGSRLSTHAASNHGVMGCFLYAVRIGFDRDVGFARETDGTVNGRLRMHGARGPWAVQQRTADR